jgi:hypothetical protein
MKNLEKQLGSPDKMLTTILDQVSAWGMPYLECDHVCYRASTQERYQGLRRELANIGTLQSEDIINGRPICIFELHDPLIFNGRTIPCLELPAPKAGSTYAEGWEHLELVVPMVGTATPRSTVEKFIQQYPALPFDLKGMDKIHNPEAGVKIPGTPYQVKFHPRSILEVIRLEKSDPHS